MLADKEMLTAILTEHVVGQQLSPDMLAGEFDTLEPQAGCHGRGFRRGLHRQRQRQGVCGNVQTANATVYIIDTVLLPKS